MRPIEAGDGGVWRIGEYMRGMGVYRDWGKWGAEGIWGLYGRAGVYGKFGGDKGIYGHI